MPPPPYDALLLVSFGGPEGPDEVLPFLENVLRGRGVPRARMLEVAEHYYRLGGASPINEQNRALVRAIEEEFASHHLKLPVYWGNRNWHPLLPEALERMAAAGVRRALALVTSAYSSYSGCRQYHENIAAAREHVGERAPEVDKLRVYFNHPGFIEPMTERVRAALQTFPAERRQRAAILFTAHSIPATMAQNCRYERQLLEACRLVAETLSHSNWRLVYQSRSGLPAQPWLEPDVGAALAELAGAASAPEVVVAPIGFISDHIEVLYDLDVEAAARAKELGLQMVRAGTVGTHPRFVRMVRELVEERMSGHPARLALGDLGPSHDVCPADCCLYAR